MYNNDSYSLLNNYYVSMFGHRAKNLSQIVSNPYYNKSVRKYYIYHFLCEEIEAQITKVQFSSHTFHQCRKQG